MADVTPTLPMTMFTLYQKRILGSLYGEANPLDDINEAFDDMLASRSIRGVIIHDH